MADGEGIAILCEVWAPGKPATFKLVVPRRDANGRDFTFMKRFGYSPPSQRDMEEGRDSMLVGVRRWREFPSGGVGLVEIRGPFVPTDVVKDMGFELELWFSLLAYGTALSSLYDLRNSKEVYKVHNDVIGGRWRTMGIGRGTERFPYPNDRCGRFGYGEIVREFLGTSEAIRVNEGWYSTWKRGGSPAA